eukprot:Skav214377  [mRNA]  locus=scaffold4284:62394:74231:- [translate_table: standard]
MRSKLQCQDPEMQAAMIRELRTVPEVHSAVINKLDDAYKMVRQAVVEFVFNLAEIGKVSETLVPSLAHEDPFVRHLHLQAIGLLEHLAQDQAASVALCLRDPLDQLVRKNFQDASRVQPSAVETLKLLGESGANTFGAYTDPETGTKLEARVLAMEALGKLGLFALPWIPQLAKCLEDPAPEVRRIAAVALGELAEDYKEAVADFAPELAACIHDGDALTRRRCIDSRLLEDDEEDEHLDVDSSILQRIMLDAMQGAEAEFIEPYLHVLVESWLQICQKEQNAEEMSLAMKNGTAEELREAYECVLLRIKQEGVLAKLIPDPQGGIFINVPFAGKFPEKDMLLPWLRKELLDCRPDIRFIRIFATQQCQALHLESWLPLECGLKRVGVPQILQWFDALKR